MIYDVDMAAYDMIYIPRFMKIGLGIPIILRSLPQQFERLQFRYDVKDLCSMLLRWAQVASYT
jgi:hypothetical protein